MTSKRRSSSRITNKSQRSILEILESPPPSDTATATSACMNTGSASASGSASALPTSSKESAPKSGNDTSTATATGTGTVSKSMSSKRKKETKDKRKLQIDACNELIDLATCEMEVDPYRGIFDENIATREWTKCWDAMRALETGNGSGSGIENDFGITCPCVKHWIQEEVEKREAAAERSRKAKRRKSGIGAKSKSRRKSKNAADISSEVIHVDDDVDANIDVPVDVDADVDKDIPTIESDEDKTSEVIILDQDSASEAQVSTSAPIPQKDNEGERGLIRRNPGHNFTCACDYNPFCIVSLGGVVDDYLNELIKIQSGTKSSFTNTELDLELEQPQPPLPQPQSLPQNISTISLENAGMSKKRPHTDLVKSQNSMAILDSETDGSTSSDGVICAATEEVELDDTGACQDSTLRKPVFIDVEKIKKHLQANVVEGDGPEEVIMAGELLSAIQRWHTSLIYPGNKRDAKEGRFTFCRPVGMRNLGATCYLNSQLQCLAANLTFLLGVFNWTQGNDHHSNQMSIVISRMQSLLARMVYGPQNVVCTDEFASAMSLQNNEMQDPNEFARLLFDRMHESFQRTPTMRNLLPNIFRGAFEYSTKCMRCKRISCREEDFMDLNLPIQRSDKSSSKELTVEGLLEEYFKPEVMDGDNKYHCDNCKDSCEAERSLAFRSTPQVLNIQLARYVFDLKTFQKQKLMDNILLPRLLYVNKQCGEKVKYILCGVQNHKGTSAYSGHYVAEVMDWPTGAWFEYNDEKVSLLEHGPSSSYDPHRTSTTRLKGGSPDAYNLFYIQEQFLRAGVREQIELNSSSLSKGVIHETSLERENSFEIHREIHIQNQKTTNRLKRRKSGILKLMLNSSSKDVPSVWVEGSTLRRFFSCIDPMEDLLSNRDKPILRHKQLLCKHGKGLHPRVARCGKMLTTDQFQAYSYLLQSEREENLQDQDGWGDATETTACDLTINRTTCLHCDECASEYQSELKEKCASYCRLVLLEQMLDPDNHAPSTEHEKLFAISRSFATNLRKFASAKTLKQALFTKSCSKSNDIDVPVVGIDHFDSSDLAPAISNPEVERHSDEKDGVDPHVNSKIACEHGHCNKISNKQTIRFLKAEIWNDINAIFPHAISIPVEYVDGKAQNCVSCLKKKNAISTVSDEICDWANVTALLLASGQEYPASTGNYRLVHAGDLIAQQKALGLVKSCRKRDAPSLEKLKNTLIGSFFSDPSSIRADGVKMHRLTCTEHTKPLLSIKTFQDIHFRAANTPPPTAITEHTEEIPITIMSEENYESYLKSMLKLQNILIDTVTSSCTFETFQSQLQLHHPQLKVSKLQSNNGNTPIQTKDILTDLVEYSDHKFHFFHEPCSDSTCISDYHQHLEQVKPIEKKSLNESKHEEKKEVEIEICASDDFCYEVHEYDGSVDANQIQSMLEKQWSERMDGIEEVQSSVRRSSRKRNSASNHTFKLQGKKTDILAQFRLLVYEKSNNKNISSHQLSIFSFDKTSRQGIMIEVLGEWNERHMHSVLSELPVTVTDDKTIHVVLSSNGETASKKRSTAGDNDESLFDMLVQMATDCQSPAQNPKAPRKRRRQERGFAGTFLQSSFHAPQPPAVIREDGNGQNKGGDKTPMEITIPADCSDLSVDECANTTSRDATILDKGIPESSRCDHDQLSSKPNENHNTTNARQRTEECTNEKNTEKKETTPNPHIDFIYHSNEEANFPLKPLSSSDSNPIPDVPSYSSQLEVYSKTDVEGILGNVANALNSNEDSEIQTIKVQMEFDRNARNAYRNFVDDNISDSKNRKEMPMSRNEMDIVLYFLSNKKTSEDEQSTCQSLLIPYRSPTSIRYLFKLIKEQGILENLKYEGYMSHVTTYVGRIHELELKFIN